MSLSLAEPVRAWRRRPALARRPSGRFADFSEIGVHTWLCLKLVRRRGAGARRRGSESAPALPLRPRTRSLFHRPMQRVHLMCICCHVMSAEDRDKGCEEQRKHQCGGLTRLARIVDGLGEMSDSKNCIRPHRPSIFAILKSNSFEISHLALPSDQNHGPGDRAPCLLLSGTPPARLLQRCSPARAARRTKQHGSTIITLSPIHLLDQWSREVGTLGSSLPSIIPLVTLWRQKPKTPFWPAAEKC
jgi:hypothetical protein